ncbi:MAG: TetR/AcrR family transcriptional regulator [Pseudomonadota bacterium]
MTTPVAKPRKAEPVSCDQNLLRSEWICAARAVLLREGAQSIAIARLARDLSVTRGAFYWHFDGRNALMTALLEDLSARCTPPWLRTLGTAGFEAGMLSLLDGVFAPCAMTEEARRHEAALRAWTDTDANAKALACSKAAHRSDAITAFLRLHGLASVEARIRGRFLATLCWGSGAQDLRTAGFSYPTELAWLFRFSSGRQLSQAALSRHLNRTLPARRQLP